ncbi:MAG TPA: glycosyltransferase [Chloroflexia bacterium]|nr:glycosyltransferase [Chloroflexia bacterium]
MVDLSTLSQLYEALVLAFLLSFLAIVAVNLIVLPRLDHFRLPAGRPPPRVAVLIPARNEEANIEAALRSLLAQDYSNYEVWLYEDDSTDSTYRIAARLAEHDLRLHIVKGTTQPPPGWLGKANACYLLYETMRAAEEPDYILFTDADVRFAPGALARAVAAAGATGSGLLSVFPRQITLSWAERLAVPMLLHWAVYTFLPLQLAFSRRTGPIFAAANGQFMLFTREAYEACGGHTSVRAEILEDVALARAVKASGYSSILADGAALVRTRMYNGPAEVWRGYSKNVFSFFNYTPLYLALGVVVLLALYVVPIFSIAYGAFTGSGAMLSWGAAQYSAAVLARLLIAARFRYRQIDVLLHPLAVLFLIAICLNSMRWWLTGQGAWKGRAFTPEENQRPRGEG